MAIDLTFVSLLCCFGTTTLLAGLLTFVSFSNQNIMNIFKKETGAGKPVVGESWYDVWEVSPTKTLYLRVPETGFLRQFNAFVLFWNNRVAFLNGDRIIYTIDNHKTIMPEDTFALLRGEDVYTINIVTTNYVVKLEERIKSLQAINTIQKGEIANLNKSTIEQIKTLGEAMRETRKSINWSPNTSPIGGLPSLRKPGWPGTSFIGGGDEEGGGD